MHNGSMKKIMLSCLVCVGLFSLAACSDTGTQTTSSNQSASIQPDTKDIKK